MIENSSSLLRLLVRKIPALLLAILPFIFHSCIPEYKIAKSFTSARDEVSLLVTSPDMIFKFNHKGEVIHEFDSMTQAMQDSALWESSSYVKYLSDSILLENFMNSFIDELRALGFRVWVGTSADSFDVTQPQSYLLDISQIQLDEYLYTYEDSYEFFDSVFVKRIILNAVDYSCWYDLKKARQENLRTTVLYGSETSYDDFEGRFFTDPFSGNIKYRYSLDTLSVKDIYAMSSYVGKKHAGYIYDFFLNQYIARHLPEGMEMTDYFHYDRKRKMILSAYDERLEVLGTRK